MANLLTGLFDTEATAENAVSLLKSVGYGQNEISIIMKDRNAAREFAVDTGSHTMEGVGTGAAIGGTLGAVLAGILGVGSIAIPGVGLLAAGSLAAMLAGAGAGGLAGSLLGWLVGAGIPEDVAPYYERGLSEGGIVVAVSAHPGDEDRVQQILQGGSIAYAGGAGQSYVAPTYAQRYNDIQMAPTVRTTPMPTTPMNTPPSTLSMISYDTAETNAYQTAHVAPEANRTVNSLNAENRSDMRTASEHSREAERDAYRTNPVSGTVAAVENEADRAQTALRNQADKVSTGASNETDRIPNP